MLTRAVSADSNTGPPLSAEAPVMSLRCCGIKPSGPPAEPFGKERIARATSSSDTVGQRLNSSRGGGIWESGVVRGASVILI